MSGGRLTADDHRSRSDRHAKMGEALLSAGDEWSAVMYFYAAYHKLKAALLEDPLFDHFDSCQAAHSDLLPEDRFTSRHSGRRGQNKEWGLNELVRVLYRPASGPYHRLHTMSIDVRYNHGLVASLPVVESTWESFDEMCRAGVLQYPHSPKP